MMGATMLRIASRIALATAGFALGMSMMGSGCPGNNPGNGGTSDSGITGQFVGSSTCQTCHANIHDDWAQTLHAGALTTLEEIGQDKNPVCLECHVVGWAEPGGFVDRATTNALAGVG